MLEYILAKDILINIIMVINLTISIFIKKCIGLYETNLRYLLYI